MKKTITLFLLLAGFWANAQKISYMSATINYTQLPVTPLDKAYKNYQVLILSDYLQKNVQAKAKYQTDAAKAENDYQTEAKKYWQTRLQDSLTVETQLNVWFRLTPQLQAVTPRPVFQPQPMPVKAVVTEPLYDKEFNNDLLATQHIKLEGYNRLPENAVIIQINMIGFESTEAKPTTQKKQVKGADGRMRDTLTYVYQFNYRHTFKVKILLPNGKFAMDELFPSTINYSTFNSKDFYNQAELEGYWYAQKNNEITAAQEKVAKDNLKAINDYLNDNHGFIPKSRTVQVIYPSAKKVNYDDLKDAATNAKSGYGIITNPATAQQGEEYLRKAIATWETALKESNLTSKKARINENVTESILLNLAEAYIWLNDFIKSQEYLNKLDTFKISGREKGIKTSIRAFNSDQNMRYSANNK